MKRQSRSPHLWVVLTVSALFVAGIGAVDKAWSAEISSGLLRVTSDDSHCAVVNQQDKDITVRISILFGRDASTCADAVQTINPGEAGGVVCTGPDAGVYCKVTGTFNPGRVRAKFSIRDSNLDDRAVLELR